MAADNSSKAIAPPRFNHRVKDLTRLKFGRLTVLAFAGRNSRKLVEWECVCECGASGIVATSTALTGGHKLSCGCLGREVTAKRSRTHGMKDSPEYQSWRSMKQRCNNKNATGFRNYGGRGIKICERWLNSFESFFSDMGKRPEPPELHEIDRIDNDGDYCRENCRWATIKQQANNRRQGRRGVCRASRLVEFQGKEFILADLARQFNIPYQRVYQRLAKGWDIQKALTTPVLR